MHLFLRTLETPAANLALEDAWLDMAEAGELDSEILRLWQPDSTFVVVGRGSQLAREVNVAAAEQAGVPVLRRISGGAAIVAAPGCLMYALLLSYERRPQLRMLDEAHRVVMQSLIDAIGASEPRLQWQGTCDLVVDSCKVSGNSLRCRRDWMLYHGTLLVGMDLTLLDRFLLHPPREPEYRQMRHHAQFVSNLELPQETIYAELARTWNAAPADVPIPRERIDRLVHQRYANHQWNYER